MAPDVLKIYIEAGIYDTTDDEGNAVVKLKMPGIYESVVFAEQTVGHEAWQGLPNIPERIPIRWIIPDRSDVDEFGIQCTIRLIGFLGPFHWFKSFL